MAEFESKNELRRMRQAIQNRDTLIGILLWSLGWWLLYEAWIWSGDLKGGWFVVANIALALVASVYFFGGRYVILTIKKLLDRFNDRVI